MKQLVSALASNLDNRQFILNHSFANCHAKGVYSIGLARIMGGGMIRLYYVEDEHELNPSHFSSIDETKEMQVGFHSHRNDVTLYVIKGLLRNYIYNKSLVNHERVVSMKLNAFKYHSKIIGGKGSFEYSGDTNLAHSNNHYIFEDSSIFMSGQTIHTVSVQKGKKASWLVIEGAENRAFENKTYSNADLTKFNFDEYYQKLEWNKIKDILKEVIN